MKTSTALAWLERHPRYTASAPRTATMLEHRAYAGIGWIRVEARSHTEWRPCMTLPMRDDWVVRNQFNEPVEDATLALEGRL